MTSTEESATAVERIPDAHHPAGVGLIKPSYDPDLTNEDVALLHKQSWSAYNIFAFWMSDVHSVGGYLTAGTLLALGIAAWQVLVFLLVGIVIVMLFANLVAKPSQRTGVPYPVINRAIFGVKGANIPAIIRGLIAIAWYGVQTFLAAQSLNIIWLKFLPGTEALTQVGFLGLDALDWISYAILWVAQAALFWRGMESIRRFIDFAGPAVYVVMVILAVYLVARSGGNINLSLSEGAPLGFWASIPVMIGAVAIVVSYFSGPMLNFGDFARYGKSFKAVRTGNFWGPPINFLFFSVLTVVTASATVPVFGRLMTDPIETVKAIDAPFAILLGGLTFVTATVGINIVANFISPAFDFSNVSRASLTGADGFGAAVSAADVLPHSRWTEPAAPAAPRGHETVPMTSTTASTTVRIGASSLVSVQRPAVTETTAATVGVTIERVDTELHPREPEQTGHVDAAALPHPLLFTGLRTALDGIRAQSDLGPLIAKQLIGLS